jgi:hypothetical protein
MEDLPTYKITIDEQYNDGVEPLGIEQIAFTSNPAVLVKGVAFKSDRVLFSADEKKYRITAPAMIPMEIYRKDEEMGEYYVQFTKDEIDNIFKEFMSGLNNKDLFNLEHNQEQTVPAYILEAWIVDNPKTDKAMNFGIEVPEGTLMVTAQITDKDYYNKLIESGQVGFSIEGFLGLKLSNQNPINMSNPTFEEGKQYKFVNGVFEEVKEEVTEEVEVEMEEVVEETEEVEMAEETVEEVVEVEAAVDPAADAEAILAIVTPLLEEKINEVLQVIADLKTEITESANEEPVEEVEMQLSAHQRFGNVTKFLQKNG